jgi:hypothetical protein
MAVGVDPEGDVARVASSLGFAFIISGISTIFRDLVILKPETDETSEMTARKTIELMQNQPINPKGLKMIASKRTFQSKCWLCGRDPCAEIGGRRKHHHPVPRPAFGHH